MVNPEKLFRKNPAAIAERPEHIPENAVSEAMNIDLFSFGAIFNIRPLEAIVIPESHMLSRKNQKGRSHNTLSFVRKIKTTVMTGLKIRHSTTTGFCP